MRKKHMLPDHWLKDSRPDGGAAGRGSDLLSDEAKWSLGDSAPRPQRRIVRMPLPFCSITSSAPPLLVSKPISRQPSVASTTKEPEERILISEVEVVGVEGELKQVAQRVLKTRPNFAYTIGEVKQDVERIFNTGWFKECIPDAVDTRDGVRLVIKVTPNDKVCGMVAAGANVLPNKVVQSAFRGMHGKPLNFVDLKRAINRLDQWYSERGVLGQVSDFGIKDGVIQLQCAEATVGSVKLEFMDPETQAPKEKPRTRLEVVQRHLMTQPGRVYNLAQAKRDVASIYSTGLFEDVNITPREAEDSTEATPKIDVDINLVERKSGGLGAGGGLATGGGLGFVGSFTYSEKNLLGLNQKLTAQVELGQIDKMFRIIHTDPWLLGDKHRTSRTISLMNNRSSGAIIHGRAEGPVIEGGPAPSGSADVLLGRLVGGVELRRPLSANWAGTLALHCQRTSCLDEHGQHLTQDSYGSPLTYSGSTHDDMTLAAASSSYSNPDDGSQLLASVEQAVALHRSWLHFTRLRLRADKPISLGPLTLVLKGKGGHVHGNLPPYEAFPIGGTNSVRGYAEGAVGSGRSWLEGSAELRFPILSSVQGSCFVDYGTDLDSGGTVIGDPAGARSKPGKGYGYGGGVRVDTPLGPLRFEYAWNDRRTGRFHVGVGYD